MRNEIGFRGFSRSCNRILYCVVLGALVYACRVDTSTQSMDDATENAVTAVSITTAPSTSQPPTASGQDTTDTPESHPSPSPTPSPQTQAALANRCEEARKPTLSAETSIPGETASLILLYEDAAEGSSFLLVDPANKSIYRSVEGYMPIDWSPSGRQLLLYRDSGLFLAAADGTDVRLAMEFPDGTDLFNTWWLSEKCVIVDVAFAPDEPQLLFDPRVHLLELDSGSLTMIGGDEFHITQAVSTSDQIWIQGGETTMEMVGVNGDRMTILEGTRVYLSTQPWRDPDIVFLPSGDALIFIGYEGTSTVGKYVTHIYLSTIHERQLLEYRSIYQPETRPHSMSISPDSLNLAFIEDNEGGPSLRILNLQTLDTLSLKPWERLQSEPVIIWSPDSQSIALSFMEQNRTKLVVVELLTQDVNLIIESTGVIEVMSWRNLEIEF